MLIKSDLPRHLEVEVAKTIKANIPAIRRGSSLKGTDISRTVGRSENPGVPVILFGHNLTPLPGEIGLTDLLNIGWLKPPPHSGVKAVLLQSYCKSLVLNPMI